MSTKKSKQLHFILSGKITTKIAKSTNNCLENHVGREAKLMENLKGCL